MLVYMVLILSILVVAVDPSYFNNNQRVVRGNAFLCLRQVWVEGWLWHNFKAVGLPKERCVAVHPAYPSLYTKTKT